MLQEWCCGVSYQGELHSQVTLLYGTTNEEEFSEVRQTDHEGT